MKHLRTIDCLNAEEAILGSSPAEAAAMLRGGGELRAHLDACAACRTLARDLAALGSVPPPVEPPADVCARAIAGAAIELRRVRREARRAVLRAAMRVALVAAIGVPLPLAWAVSVWRYGAVWLAPLLPQPLLVFLGGAFALACLAGLSALAFTLTLIAGAAARPPRAPAWS